jgi:hypothetical protein
MVCAPLSSTNLNPQLTLNNGSPACQKEVLNSVSSNPVVQHDGSASASENLAKRQPKANLHPLKPQPTPRSSGQQESPTSLTETSIQKELEINEDDIAIFKRIVQQITRSDKPLSGLSNTNNLDSPSVTQRGASSAISRLRHTEPRQREDWEYHPLVYEYLLLLREIYRVSQRVYAPVEDGEPTSFQRQEQTSFYREWGVNAGGQISDFIKPPFLLSRPRINHQKLEYCEPKPEEGSDILKDRVNEWILDKLCSSPLDVNLLARTFEKMAGKAQDDWQFDVVAFWHLDGRVKSPTAKPAPSFSLDCE